jgi:hypothetical protein
MGRVVILVLGFVEHLLVLLFIGLWFAVPRYPIPTPNPTQTQNQTQTPTPTPAPTLTRFVVPRYPRWVRLTLARREHEARQHQWWR